MCFRLEGIDQGSRQPLADFIIGGGDGFFSVYLSGITDSVTNADSSDSPSSSSDSDSGATTSPTTSAKPSTVTVGGKIHHYYISLLE